MGSGGRALRRVATRVRARALDLEDRDGREHEAGPEELQGSNLVAEGRERERGGQSGHLLRRTSELIADSIAGQARVPRAARRILKDALALRDQRDEDVIEADEFDLKVTDLEARTEKLLATRPTHEPNCRLLQHLRNEREHMFTFLTESGVEATNWRAEQALRPAIVNRKSWGGNRTQQGARTQQITMSVIRTARRQKIDPVELMVHAQHSRRPAASDLIGLPARASPTPIAA